MPDREKQRSSSPKKPGKREEQEAQRRAQIAARRERRRAGLEGLLAQIAEDLADVRAAIAAKRHDSPISVFFDGDDFTEEEIELCLTYLADSYRENGGMGLKVVGDRALSTESAEVVR